VTCVEQCALPTLSLPRALCIQHDDATPSYSCVQGLLQKDPRRRLGCGPDGVLEVMSHPFFAGVDWAAMEAVQVRL
jgi:hypothetical protein